MNMETELLCELAICKELCTKLEQLLQRNVNESTLCITGDIYVAYTDFVNSTIQITNELKKEMELIT